MSSLDERESIHLAVELRDDTPTAFESGEIIAIEELPASIARQLPFLDSYIETIGGRAYVRMPDSPD